MKWQTEKWLVKIIGCYVHFVILAKNKYCDNEIENDMIAKHSLIFKITTKNTTFKEIKPLRQLFVNSQ